MRGESAIRTQAHRVTIVDHGAGNIRSVVRALTRVGAEVEVTADPAQVRRAERLVMPGQGAFADCMARLQSSGLDDALREHLAAERPYLGICLGLQVLFEVGLEHGRHAGLGVLSGACVPLPNEVPGEPETRLKIPHMGWNTVRWAGEPEDSVGSWFYFVHSYHVVPSETEGLELASTDYGLPFVSAIRRGNLLACQFHPEKSHRVGLKLLESFIEGAE